jgi:tyrosine-protein kinase Etk/Wzc
MDNRDNLLGVLDALLKWRKPLISLCLAVGIIAAGLSMLMPTYYKASTIFLVASPDQSKPELLFNRGMSLRTEYFGNANDIDRILTIAESGELLQHLVDSFNLYTHYKIDPNNPKATHLIREEFLSLYSVKKTKRDGIELSVEDTNPQIASNMANAARQKIEDIAKRLIRQSQNLTIEAFQNNISSKEALMLSLGDSLAALRSQYKIYNVVAQTEALSAQKSEAVALFTRDSVRLQVLRSNSAVPRDTIYMLEGKVAGLREEIKVLQSEMNLLNSGVSVIYNLEKQYAEANQILAEDRERLKQWQAANRSDTPALLLVDAAQAPVVKSRPKRSILVIAAVLAALLFGVFGLLLMDSFKKLQLYKTNSNPDNSSAK